MRAGNWEECPDMGKAQGAYTLHVRQQGRRCTCSALCGDGLAGELHWARIALQNATATVFPFARGSGHPVWCVVLVIGRLCL